MNRLIIVGASGHGRVVADIAALIGYRDIVFLDRNPEIQTCANFPVLGSDRDVEDFEGDLFIAIGDNEIREKIMELHNHRSFPVLIHPSAVIASDVKIGAGSVIMAGAVVNPGVVLGRGVIVNTSSSIDHDCEIGDFVHVAVGAHLSGTVRVGNKTWIGTGASVRNNVNICGACTIGAGAVVIRDIKESGTYVGVPAMMMNKFIKWRSVTSPPPPEPEFNQSAHDEYPKYLLVA